MDPDSAGSQFYFCLGAQHNLDSGYTVFGTTVEGLDVISQLRAGERSSMSRSFTSKGDFLE